MGFTRHGVRFLLHCQANGVDFSACATIGRQGLHLTAAELRNAFAKAGKRLSPAEADGVFRNADHFAEPLLFMLGAALVDSFDASVYENATVIADFNEPLEDSYKERYSIVIDGGSLEHVFNYPQALKNAMEMVRPGGHLVLIAPTHSRSGHGFYQLSPELFFRALCDSNGYDPPVLLLGTATGDRWYRVPDPAAVGRRVLISNRVYSDHLFVVARRARITHIFATWPQQSDYEAAWIRPSHRPSSMAGLKGYLRANRQRIPRPLLRLYTALFRSESRSLQRIDL